MRQFARNLKEGKRLLRSDDSIETVAAVLILGFTLGPIAYRLWKFRQEVKR